MGKHGFCLDPDGPDGAECELMDGHRDMPHGAWVWAEWGSDPHSPAEDSGRADALAQDRR